MSFVSYFSAIIIPFIIAFTLCYGIIEKKNVYDIFLKGVKNGFEIVIKIFPTLLAIFLAINMLKTSGITDFVINIINPVLDLFNIPKEIMPLAILRPISGSASLGIATNIIQENGVDSKIGLISAIIMGSTETTFYTIALYTSEIGIRKMRNVILTSLIANFVGVITSIITIQFM